MDENELGMNVGYEADYRGKYMSIENNPLINDGSGINMEEKITAWIARDENGGLFFYSEKPCKLNEIGAWDGKVLLLPQVKWGDKEPTKVELTIKICE